MKHFLQLIPALFLLMLTGCASMNVATVMLDVKATSDKITSEKAYNMATGVLVDKGFDIKIANKDIGLITTEYKKWGAFDGNPPFDFYLQIKTQLKTRADGKLVITMTPQVKQSNRLNSSAFTEEELQFITDEEIKNGLSALGQVYLKGQHLFLNVVSGIAEGLGLTMEQLEYNKQLIQF